MAFVDLSTAVGVHLPHRSTQSLLVQLLPLCQTRHVKTVGNSVAKQAQHGAR